MKIFGLPLLISVLASPLTFADETPRENLDRLLNEADVRNKTLTADFTKTAESVELKALEMQCGNAWSALYEFAIKSGDQELKRRILRIDLTQALLDALYAVDESLDKDEKEKAEKAVLKARNDLKALELLETKAKSAS